MQINQNTIIFAAVVAVAVGGGLYWATSKSIQAHMHDLEIGLNQRVDGRINGGELVNAEINFHIFNNAGYLTLYVTKTGDSIILENLRPIENGFSGIDHDTGKKYEVTLKTKEEGGGKKRHRSHRKSHRKSVNRRR